MDFYRWKIIDPYLFVFFRFTCLCLWTNEHGMKKAMNVLLCLVYFLHNIKDYNSDLNFIN